jgi:hypothetical protein
MFIAQQRPKLFLAPLGAECLWTEYRVDIPLLTQRYLIFEDAWL